VIKMVENVMKVEQTDIVKSSISKNGYGWKIADLTDYMQMIELIPKGTHCYITKDTFTLEESVVSKETYNSWEYIEMTIDSDAKLYYCRSNSPDASTLVELWNGESWSLIEWIGHNSGIYLCLDNTKHSKIRIRLYNYGYIVKYTADSVIKKIESDREVIVNDYIEYDGVLIFMDEGYYNTFTTINIKYINMVGL